jgi:hydroxymethylglutaryl-CoA lyase
MSAAISIYEVGPRDGLQNLGKTIPLRKKVKLVKRLKKAGLKDIEVGSLVHPSVTPMRDSGKLFKKMGGDLLVLNRKGLERAKDVGAESVNAVISTSDVFIQNNQNATYEDTKRFYEDMAKEIAINRLYISCCFSPDTTEEDVLDCVSWGKDIARHLVLCDTDSSATKDSVYSLCSKALDITPDIGVHLHVSDDITACMMSAYDAGIRMFDSSIGGLGGCISLTAAEGNIATEILVMWAIANDIPIKQSIDIDEMMDVGEYAISLESTNTERFGRWVSRKIGALL